MPTLKELMREGRQEEVWRMCCGFLDLNAEPSRESFEEADKLFVLDVVGDIAVHER